MFPAVKSELIRIRRPSFLWGGLGLMGLFSALISVFVFTAAGDGADRFGPQLATLAELASSGGFVAALATVSGLIGVVTLAFWAIATATDYDSGLVRVLTQAEPNRLRLLAGKVGALVLFTVAGTFLATVVAAAIAWPLAAANGVSTAAWTTGMFAELVGAWANLTIAALVWGAVGLAVAMVTRSAGIAIAAGIGYLMVFENLIGLVAENAVDYLPGGTLTAVANGGNAAVGYAVALALAAVYGLAALATSAVVFARREITS